MKNTLLPYSVFQKNSSSKYLKGHWANLLMQQSQAAFNFKTIEVKDLPPYNFLTTTQEEVGVGVTVKI